MTKNVLTPAVASQLRLLTKPQRDALRIMFDGSPTLQVASGIPGSTWKALRAKGLVRHSGNEREWHLTPDGLAVQRALDEEEGRVR